jgi:glycogen synthase
MTDAQPSTAGGANDGIALLVTNEFLDDPRVFRAATALAEDGHRTSVVCFVDNATHPAVDEYRGVRVLRIARSSSLIGGLRGRFVRPGAIAPSAPTPELSRDVADNPRCSEPDRRVSLREQLIESGVFLNNNLRWFVKVLRLCPTAVYANDLDTLPVSALLALIRRVPLIYDSHELFAEMLDPPRPFFKRMLTRLESRLIKRARLVVTVNPSIAGELSRRYGIEPPLVIFNCPPYQETLESDTTMDDGSRVIYHGGYAPDRGIEELLEAARHLDGASLFLRGMVSPPVHIAEAVSRATNPVDGSPKATLLPRVPMNELVASLRGFDIGVIPYKATCLNNYYSSPNKLFEYMMGGLAIAAADLPEIRRVVEEYENGVLFDPSDPADIAEKINALASDRTRLDGMKRNSLRGAAEQYNWEMQRPRLLRAVDDCLDCGKSSP